MKSKRNALPAVGAAKKGKVESSDPVTPGQMVAPSKMSTRLRVTPHGRVIVAGRAFA